MEIVVCFASGEDGQKQVAPCSDVERVGLFAQVVRERVDEEGAVPDEDASDNASPDVSSERVTVRPPNQGRRDKSEGDCEGDVVLVLESDDRIGFEVFAIDETHSRVLWLAEDPAHVAVVQALVGVVRVVLRVCESVMQPMSKYPPSVTTSLSV